MSSEVQQFQTGACETEATEGRDHPKKETLPPHVDPSVSLLKYIGCAFFCSNLTSEELHEFTTFNIDKTIRDMASEMCDSELLISLAGGIDLVAAEGKYHLSCLTSQALLLSKLKHARLLS